MNNEGWVNHGKTSHATSEQCDFCEMVRTTFSAEFARFNLDVVEFLRESNNIEDVWDDRSLQQAIYAWDYVIGQEKLTPGVILKTHKILMLHHKLRPNEKGYFRKEQVYIGNREGKPWYAVPELIAQWCVNVNDVIDNFTDEDPEFFITDLVKKHHIAYETIHPFIDGNGRTGRIFLNWQRAKMGQSIMIIKEQEKKVYYGWFEE